jgi:hypothetical protein
MCADSGAWLMLHPCNTAAVLALLVADEADNGDQQGDKCVQRRHTASHTAAAYLLHWLAAVVAPVLQLRLPTWASPRHVFP